MKTSSLTPHKVCQKVRKPPLRTLKIRFTPPGPATNSFRVFVTGVRPPNLGTTKRARYRPQIGNPERPETNEKGNKKKQQGLFDHTENPNTESRRLPSNSVGRHCGLPRLMPLGIPDLKSQGKDLKSSTCTPSRRRGANDRHLHNPPDVKLHLSAGVPPICGNTFRFGSLRLWRWVVSLGTTLKVFRGACFGTLTSSLSHRSGSTPVWIHSTSSPSQRLVLSTTVVHQHKERVQNTVGGCGQVREDDLTRRTS